MTVVEFGIFRLLTKVPRKHSLSVQNTLQEGGTRYYTDLHLFIKWLHLLSPGVGPGLLELGLGLGFRFVGFLERRFVPGIQAGVTTDIDDHEEG